MKANVTVQYDYDQSSRNFEEMFERYGNNNSDVYFISQYGENSKPTMSELFKINGNNKKADLYNMLEWSGNYYEDITRDEAIDETYMCFDTIRDFKEAAEDCGVKYKQLFELVETKGYSQGDYCEVIVLEGQEWAKSLIDNYFWDAPIWGRVELEAGQDFEFDFCEMDITEYWNYPYDIDDCKKDVEKFLNARFEFAAAKDKIVNTIMEAFPCEIEYPRC